MCLWCAASLTEFTLLMKQGLSVKVFLDIIDRASENIDSIRYNQTMVKSLHNDMLRMKELIKSLDDEAGQMPNVVKELQAALQSGERLIRRHAERFDITNFYTIEEVKEVIETVRQKLHDSIHTKEMGDRLPMEIIILDNDVESDRQFLVQLLQFILGRGDSCPSGSFQQEWCEVKESLSGVLQPITISDDEIDWSNRTKISKGSSCVVYKAKWVGHDVAVKILHVPSDYSGIVALAHFTAEAIVNAFVHHPHVVHVDAVDRSGVLVMELATGNLMGWYNQQSMEDWKLKLHVLHQAALGLEHLHFIGLIHRDVKSPNFLVFSDESNQYPTVKICDLGIAIGQTKEWRTTIRQPPGTALYFAPEIYKGKPHSFMSDVFSFGVVTLEVLTNRAPYTGMSFHAVMEMKLRGVLPCRIPDDCPKELESLIVKCLSPDPHERPSMEKVKGTLEILLECSN